MEYAKVSACKGYPQLFVPVRVIRTLCLQIGDEVSYEVLPNGDCVIKKKVIRLNFIRKRRPATRAPRRA